MTTLLILVTMTILGYCLQKAFSSTPEVDPIMKIENAKIENLLLPVFEPIDFLKQGHIEETIEDGKITYSTILNINDVRIKLQHSISPGYKEMSIAGYKCIGLSEKEKEKITEFEKCFLYPIEAFLPPEIDEKTGKLKIHHQMYTQIVESNYSQKGQWHEIRWNQINKKIK